MKIILRYSFIFAFIALALMTIIIFLSRILEILGVIIISFVIGFVVDYLEATKGRRKKRR
jgi:uncharacterized membrane protein